MHCLEAGKMTLLRGQSQGWWGGCVVCHEAGVCGCCYGAREGQRKMRWRRRTRSWWWRW